VPPAKKSANHTIEVILPDSKPLKGVVKFTTEQRPVEVTNIYLSRQGLQKLGNPDGLKVTIEPYNPA